MNNILTKVNTLSKNNDDTLYDFISEQLTHESKDIALWLSLAITITSSPFGDEEKGIAFVQKALTIDSNNPIALIILAYIYEYHLGGVDDMLLHQIKTIHVDSDEINSILKYVASWSYSETKKDNPEIREKLLKESIKLYDKHVWNYMSLVRLYTQQGRYLEINNLIKKALNNIQKIYLENNNDDITDIDEFINEIIKGIHLTSGNAESIRKQLIPKYIILCYMIITPVFYLYFFVKSNILHLMNLEK